MLPAAGPGFLFHLWLSPRADSTSLAGHSHSRTHEHLGIPCQLAYKSTEAHTLQPYSDPQTVKALPEGERTALPGRVPYLLAVLMPWCVHEAVVVEESQLLAEQAVHNVGPSILPLQQASKGAVQVGAQVWGPVISVERQLEREEGEKG